MAKAKKTTTKSITQTKKSGKKEAKKISKNGLKKTHGDGDVFQSFGLV